MTTASFDQLQLSPAQLANLDSMGYHTMTPIQAEALPHALAGKDLIAQAKTGSGKTAAFGIALLNRINPRDFGAQALVLCPTRELSAQVADDIRRLARYQQNIKVVTLCGGQPIGPQIGSLEHGAHVVIGTPGRIRDHLRKQTLSLARVNTLVLDEADRMLEMGFSEHLEAIVEDTPRSRQTLLFSATYPDDIRSLSARYQNNPIQVSATEGHGETNIEQRFFIADADRTVDGLLTLVNHFNPSSAVIFCNTKQSTREISQHLAGRGYSVKALHGDLDQRERDQVLVQFRNRSCSLLVATDVAARGLDIDDLPIVINYQLPRDADVYTHRIGRTGRAGKAGLALTLFTAAERYKLDLIGAEQQREISFDAIETVSTGARSQAAASSSTPAPPPYITLCIAAGRKEKIRPGDILGALTGSAGIAGHAVGKIDVLDYAAYVAVERNVARQALLRLSEGKIKGRIFKVRAV